MALLCPVMSRIRQIASRSVPPLRSNNRLGLRLRKRRLRLAAWGAGAALLAAAGTVSAQMMSIPGKFSVGPTGNANYSIPIAVPPGTAGMTPSLSLDFSSQSGNGIVGVGWSLSGLASIGRCPQTVAQDGVNYSITSTVTYTANDRFCMDGQRLVATSGAYGNEGTEYRTEIDSFNRIISHGTAGTGPAWFEVHTKTGQVMQFGNTINNTSNSQVLAQGKTTVRSWLLNQVSDTKGNYYTVKYTNDAANGQAYPVEIDYTGNAAANVNPNNKVLFSYTSRPDITGGYQAGSLSRTTVLLTNVQTQAGGSVVANYQLAYVQNGTVPASRLSSVTLCGSDGSCLPATTFAGTGPWDGTFIAGAYGIPNTNFGMPSTPSWVPIVGDFNGDGRTDFAMLQNATLKTYLSNGDGSFAAGSYNIPNGWSFGAPTPWSLIVGDFNGDGKTDWAMFGNTVLHTFMSNGDGTFTGGTYTIPTGWSFGMPTPWLLITGDFNGDGRADFAFLGNSSLITFFSNGDGSFTPVGWLLPNSLNFGMPASPNFMPVIGDFNGDGKTDFAMIGGGQAYVFLSNGDGTSAVRNFALPSGLGSGPGGYTASATPIIGDFNGDGKTDFGLLRGTTLYTFLSAGDGTFVAGSTTIPNVGFGGLGTTSIPTIGDFNGDGRTDFAILASNVIYTYQSNGDGTFAAGSYNIPYGWNFGNPATPAWTPIGGDFNGDGKADLALLADSILFTFISNDPPPYQLSTITTGVGATTSITYSPLTSSNAVYTKGSAARYPLQDVQVPLYVVSSVGSSNGIGGTYTTNYSYAGANVDVSGRGFLGFAQMNTFDPQTSIAGATYFNQAFPLTGTVASAAKTLNGNTLNQTWNSYQFFNANNHSTISSPSITSATNETAPYRVSLFNSVSASNDLDGTALPTVTTTYGQNYDAYNNPTLVVVSTPDGYSKTTSNTYNNDTTNWFLGRLTQAQVTSTTPAPPAPPVPPQPADMTVTSSPNGAFTQGQPGATYTITVSNVGSGPTSGAVTVEDIVPTGLTAEAMAGTGWTCEVGLGSPNCTRSDVLAAGASYPPITLTVNVAANAPSSVTNVVTVSGGGEVNTGNDTYSDPTTINPASGGNKVYLTSGTTWTVPSNWNSSNNTIEVIGGGGGGSAAVLNASAGAGGGGGGYSKIANLALTPGGSVTYQVGTAGGVASAGGDTWFNGASLAAASVGAKGGGGASATTAGAGGAATSGVGTTKFTGGNGGAGNSGGAGGGGGGGAAGPNGAGGNGAANPTGTLGGGGGGAAGGLPTSGGAGGTGGNNSGGSGGGPAGTPNDPDTVDGSAGLQGGGGGGGAGNNNMDDGWGGNGGPGSEWSSADGSGGGAGGGGGSSNALYAGGGGTGGTYGGGGSGGGYTSDTATPPNNTAGPGGSGAQGLIVITYGP
jgi:Salmonella virulence plasmid 65kDa B protein/Insecticide toxin TcdB middle/N-terminal region/FG-GAP-like repeat